MLPTVHAVVLAALLLWPGAAEGPDPIAGDTTTLQFFGFRAGASLDELSARLASLSGGPPAFKRPKAEPRRNRVPRGPAERGARTGRRLGLPHRHYGGCFD